MEIQLCNQRPNPGSGPGKTEVTGRADSDRITSTAARTRRAWLKQKARFLPESKLHQEAQQLAIRWLKSGWGLALRHSWKWDPVVATQPTGRRVAVSRTMDSSQRYSTSKVWPQVVFWSLVPGAPGNVQCEVCQNITVDNQVRSWPSA